jgi:hypothetical protein
VNSFVLRHPDKIIKTKSVSQEQKRLQVPRMFLERTVQDRKEHVQVCVAELVFNLDEAGILDWEDRKTKTKTKTAIAPTTMIGQTMHDTSRNISNRETYFGDCLCLCCRRIVHSLYNHVASLEAGPGAAQEACCSIQGGFRLEVESQALH